jgi:hypothetical protein
MGIDYTGCEAIFQSLKLVKMKNKLLTLGRQGIHIPTSTIDFFLRKYGYYHLQERYCWGFCEKLFTDLGFQQVDSLDHSNYEGASIIHNMNQPIEPSMYGKYDYILDAGTIEHIFNTPQVCENIINMLSIGGIFVSITPNNNLSGHGIYQFSPEFYLSAFSSKYGMEVKRLYLSKVGYGFSDWIDVSSVKEYQDGRNICKFDGNEHVYIIAIIEKISNIRENLIHCSPNQYSYEHIEWIH